VEGKPVDYATNEPMHVLPHRNTGKAMTRYETANGTRSSGSSAPRRFDRFWGRFVAADCAMADRRL